MRILQCKSKSEAVDIVAQIIIEKIEARPSSVIGLATGKTMIPVYEAVKNMPLKSKDFFEQTLFFMLDEYLGLPEDHPSSFKSYINLHVIGPLKLKQNQFIFPSVNLKDAPSNYEKKIQEAGGIDLQILGVGVNGHIGFNEPGSTKNSRTQIVSLAPETLLANKDQFFDNKIPSMALSMGVGTILESKSIVMLAIGKSKADVIKYLMNHHDDPSCPITFLKDHPHFTLVLDPEAASKINLNI